MCFGWHWFIGMFFKTPVQIQDLPFYQLLVFSSLYFGVFKVSLVVVGDIVQYHCLILYLHQ